MTDIQAELHRIKARAELAEIDEFASPPTQDTIRLAKALEAVLNVADEFANEAMRNYHRDAITDGWFPPDNEMGGVYQNVYEQFRAAITNALTEEES